MVEAVKCKHCHSEPVTKEISGCWYTWCDKCCHNNKELSGKVSMYNFLGFTKDSSIRNWNAIHDKPISEAQIAAAARQKARLAAKRAAKEMVVRANEKLKKAEEERPKMIGIENVKPQRL